MKRKLVFCLCLLLCLAGSARASDMPYGGYVATPYGSVAPTPLGYTVDEYLTAQDMGLQSLSAPNDLFVNTKRGEVLIADTGNARVVVLDSSLHFLREYTGAGKYAFVSPKGVFMDDAGHVYVADEALGMVLEVDTEGALTGSWQRPVSDMYDESTPFAPQKVTVDSAGRVYVLSQGVYQGLVCFQPDGTFLSFYGANHVEVTAKVVLQKLLRMVTTRDQWAGMEAFIPIEYSNIDIMEDEDLIYAAVGTLEQRNGNSVYVLNPLGVAYRKYNCGPLIDVLSDTRGFYTVLTRDPYEILEFSRDGGKGPLLTAAGKGSQKGLFQDPAALERLGEDLLVLDRQSGTLTRFCLTEFGRLVHLGNEYSSRGMYQEAVEVYGQILRMDRSFTPAYIWLGKACFEMEQYEQAMHYYRIGVDREGYSEAFKEHLTDLIRQNVVWVVFALAVLFVLIRLAGVLRRKKGKDEMRRLSPWRHPFACMFHALSGFEGVKLYGHGSVISAAVLVGMLFVSSVVSYVLTGFAYNPNRIETLNVLLLLAGSLGSFGIFYLAALAVSSLMSDCEGKPRELLIVSAYALLPFILGSLISAGITNFLSLDVAPFVAFFQYFCVAWSVVLMTVGMMQVNQLTLKKTLLYLLLVILCMIIVVVLLVLLYSLVQQFFVFLQTLYSEMMYRM